MFKKMHILLKIPTNRILRPTILNHRDALPLQFTVKSKQCFERDEGK